MNLIAMTANNRPEFLRQVLFGLARCCGIRDYTLLAYCEPGCYQVIKMLENFKGPKEVILHINPTKLGCRQNYCDLMDAATSMADFVVDLEDDTVPSPDFLAYMDWARNRYADDHRVFSISGYSQEQPSDLEIYTVRRRPWFASWGHGMWAHNWRKVRLYSINEKVHSWDMPIADYVIAAGLVEIFPVLSRIQNIGFRGTHVKNAGWHAQNHYSPHVADCQPGWYYEK